MLTFLSVFSLLMLFQITPPTQLPETISFLLGAFASIVVQFLKGKVPSMTGRFVLAVLLSIVVGVASYFIAKPVEANLVVFVIHVFAYSQIAYTAFWKFIWEGLLKFRKIGG